MAGYDDHGPQLYQIDPSGSYFAWKASGEGGRVLGLGRGAASQWAQCTTLQLSLIYGSAGVWWACSRAERRTF